MKFSEHWLRTFVDPALDTRGLADALTFAGIEVEEIEAAAPAFEGVVVGEVLSVEKHPAADRLVVCGVNVGGETLRVVCGAPNVRAGIKVPTARVGAQLPQLKIEAANVRGVPSQGMLCSGKELGLNDDASGLMVLPPDAPAGTSVRELLSLDDQILVTKPTPNRGDCLSILGMAREVSAITGAECHAPRIDPVREEIAKKLPVSLDAPQACPRYCGRLVEGVNAAARTPDWMVSRLERSGIRAISAIVDITNYVMLELGQPLHAFDARTLAGGIRVRFAREGETVPLLNGETPTLDPGYLVIADEEKAVALAGIMGGAPTAVSDGTREVFLESAFFSPDAIAGKSRALGFGSDSSFRFERGVDFGETRRALDRATHLIVEICGGRAGPVSEALASLPSRDRVRLRLERVERVLGIGFEPARATAILRSLGFEVKGADRTFEVTPPSYRFDIAIEEDLIEELARIHGYDNIPAAAPLAHATMTGAPETQRSRTALRARLVDRGYHEVVTYAFVDRDWEQDFCANDDPVALANPIASHMSVMRSSLIPGLVAGVEFNVRHKQDRVRLFEIGRCFEKRGTEYSQPIRIGAAAYGNALPEQWGERGRRVDFYDVKGDLEALLAPRRLRFEPDSHPAFHPGRAARIVDGGRVVGRIGELHPRWQQKYGLPLPPVLFEVDQDAIAQAAVPAFSEVPTVPPVRRDIAALFDEERPHQAIIDELRRHAPAIVVDIQLFDVYRGKDLEKGKKSLAFSVLLQDTRKTLTDEEVETAVSQLREILSQRLGAKLR
jgi:phenylalanyl-tRNA synthetase beta chain